MATLEIDPFAPENIHNRAYIEYKPFVRLDELITLMTSFCEHIGELTSTERAAALFIIQKGIESTK